jgi:glycosyltransferase involved in cell wall biosynthesis
MTRDATGKASNGGSLALPGRQPSRDLKISILIPAYEYEGRASFFLSRLLASVRSQTYQNFEVIVTDHSMDNVVEKVCEESGLAIFYIRNSENRGNSSENMNLGLRHASGDVAKVMHMDDFFTSTKALDLIINCFRDAPDTLWGVLGFSHFLDEGVEAFQPIVPSLTTTLGCPSVSFFRRVGQHFDEFDSNLIVINDHDMHQRLLLKYGRPAIVPDLCVGIGVTRSQVSKMLPGEREAAELAYFLSKRELLLSNFERSMTFSGLGNPVFGYVASANVTKRGVRGAFAAGEVRGVLVKWAKFWREIFLGLSSRRSALTGRSGRSRFSITDYVELKQGFSATPPSLDDDLSRLANRFGSDKGTRVPMGLEGSEGPRLFFTPAYDFFLGHLRDKPIRLLEIGIGAGSSLPMWSQYFPRAIVFAADINSYPPSTIDRVTTVRFDQTDRVALRKFVKKHGPFDVIIDDGGHMMGQQQISLGTLFPALNEGGLYFVEDLHTSYWPFGKYKDLYGTALDINTDRSNTTMNYLEELVRTGLSTSQFLNDEENEFLSRNVAKCFILNLPETEYGPNRLAVLKKI